MAATSKKSSGASSDGADGWCGQEIPDHTTPSARAEVASRLLLIVQPPLLLLRRGASNLSIPQLRLQHQEFRNSASCQAG